MLLLGCGTPMICCASDFYHSPSLLSLPLARLTGLPVSRLLQPSWCVPEPFSPPRDGGGGLKADHQPEVFSALLPGTPQTKAQRGPTKYGAGSRRGALTTTRARSLPTSCKLYWDARRDYKKGMVQLSLGLLLLLAVVGEALWASPGVARSATGFSLTARPASPPRPLPPLKENL